MKLRIHSPVFLVVIISILACQSTIPYQAPTPSQISAADHIRRKPVITPSSSPTPIPSSTSTPTGQVTLLTATQTSVAPPSPTIIPIRTQMQIFENLWRIVNDTYIYPDFNGLDWNEVRQKFKNQIAIGMTNEQFYTGLSDLIYSLGDDHSYFLDPVQVAEQEAEYRGTHDYIGIGVYISAVPGTQRAVILSVSPGSPAELGGLRPRDSILSVDGTPILDEDGYLQDIVRGPEGTGIDVSVQTPGEDPRLVHLVRQKLTASYPVDYQVITTPEGERIGYIFLITFMVDSVDEQVADALKDMSSQSPLDGLILDNRMNEGGSSWVLEPVLGYFVSGRLGQFVSRDSSTPLNIKLHDINGSSSVPMVVLVGEGTASFGEIFSGILQDARRAYVIGTTTDGNVEILWGYDFEDGSELWLANETFQPKNHPEQDWEKSGIIPDLTVEGNYDQFSFTNDPAIQAAVQYLSEQ